MKEYRTQEQFTEIWESISNGNWTQGARECIEYGFWANDLINEYENTFEYEGYDDMYAGMKDIALLIELSMKLRGEE